MRIFFIKIYLDFWVTLTLYYFFIRSGNFVMLPFSYNYMMEHVFGVVKTSTENLLR